jgi:hypothetical protein
MPATVTQPHFAAFHARHRRVTQQLPRCIFCSATAAADELRHGVNQAAQNSQLRVPVKTEHPFVVAVQIGGVGNPDYGRADTQPGPYIYATRRLARMPAHAAYRASARIASVLSH